MPRRRTPPGTPSSTRPLPTGSPCRPDGPNSGSASSTWETASTPAVAFGKVLVTTLGGLFALNAATGAPVWNNSNARGFSSPAVYNGSLYAGTSRGTVIRLDATDGHVIWDTRLLANPAFS